MNVRMVITDLDGTLARSDASVSQTDRATLEDLGERGLIRVIATGRNLFSAKTILEPGFPIDYLIFSCGAGIFDWKRKSILNAEQLDKQVVSELTRRLMAHQIDFSVQDKIPNNHCFSYVQHNRDNQDFKRRLELYQGYTRTFNPECVDEASQVIAILDDDVTSFLHLQRECESLDVKIVRATSPINGRSIWMEFLPPEVSKAFGVHFLCQRLNINPSQTCGIGNDYNDIDLLDFCKHRFVVDNAPDELKKAHQTVASNNHDGFSQAILQIL